MAYRVMGLDVMGLLEELANIYESSCVGNGQEPIWDGTCISKERKNILLSMKMIEKSNGYLFPTELGKAVYLTFLDVPHALSDYGYNQFLKGKAQHDVCDSGAVCGNGRGL